MASSFSSSSLPPRAPGRGGAAAAAFQSLEGKIESMQCEYKEKLRALECKKREAQTMQEDLLVFRQAKQLLKRKAAVLNMQLQQANLQLFDSQVQVDTATHANQEFQSLFALYHHHHEQQQQQQQPNGSNSTNTIMATQQDTDGNDNAAAVAVAVADAAADNAAVAAAAAAASDSVLSTLLEEGARWEAKGLESEVQVRLLRRLNLLMEKETQKFQHQFEEKQEEKSRLIRQNLRSEESARLVAAHEAMVAQKKALQQQRGVKMRVWKQIKSKKTRLEELKQKARAMDASLRVEEARYMNMHGAGAAAAASTTTTAPAASTTTTAAAVASAPSVVTPASLATATATAGTTATATTAVVIPYIPAHEHEIPQSGRQLEKQQQQQQQQQQ